MHYSEAMLFVHNDEAELGELHCFLDQRVRANHQLCIALRNMASRCPLAIFFQRTGEENHAVSLRFEQLARGEIVLGCKDLCGRHKSGLKAILHCDHRGFEGDESLARADVALQQAAHGNGRLHVSGDFAQYFFLRCRWTEREKAFDRVAYPFIQLEADAGAAAEIAPLKFESHFEEEQLLEDETTMCRRIARFEICKAFSYYGKVCLLEGVAA